jgi:hypothetical protein
LYEGAFENGLMHGHGTIVSTKAPFNEGPRMDMASVSGNRDGATKENGSRTTAKAMAD